MTAFNALSYVVDISASIPNKLARNKDKKLKSETLTNSQSKRNKVSVNNTSTDQLSSDSWNTSANRNETSSEEVLSDINLTDKCNVLDRAYLERLWNEYNLLRLKSDCTEGSTLSYQTSKQPNECCEYSKEKGVPTTEEEVEDLLRELNLTCTNVNDLPGNRPDSPILYNETDSSDDHDEVDESESNSSLSDELNSLPLQSHIDISKGFDEGSECEWGMDSSNVVPATPSEYDTSSEHLIFSLIIEKFLIFASELLFLHCLFQILERIQVRI